MSKKILARIRAMKDKTINGTATVYSDEIDLKHYNTSGNSLGFQYKAISAAGTPNVNITLEQSRISGSEFADSGNAAINVADEVDHINKFTILPIRYARFKVVGQTGNPTDTVMNIYAMFWE